MAEKTITITSWDGNIMLNTANESNIAHASFIDTYIIRFAGVKPELIEVFYEHATLSHTDGKIRLYQKGHASMTNYDELINSAPDTDQEAVPILMDSAAGIGSVVIDNFTAEYAKVFIDKGSCTSGTVLLSLGIRNK